MLKLYFIRHGETLSNIWHTLQGWSDTPLTKKGIEQGKCLGKGLNNIPFHKIYCSTSERTYDTATYARNHRDIELIMCKGLKEMNFGTYETKANDFEGCETYLQRIQYAWDKAGGENLEMVCKRIGDTIDSIIEENKDKDGNIMCVTHGISMLAAIRHADEALYQKCLQEETRFGNCCVTILVWDNDKLSVETINDMSYIENGGYHEENH